MRYNPLRPMGSLIRKAFQLFLHRIEKVIDHSWAHIRSITGHRRPAVIVPFVGYASDTQVRILGRVIEDYKHTDFTEGRGRFKHFVRVVKLFFTFDISEAKLKATYRDHELLIESNSEGHFSEVLKFDSKDEAGTLEDQADLELLEHKYKNLPPTKAHFKAKVIHSTPATDLLVVSDIDDTIMKSRATSMLRLVFKTLFYPVDRRETFLDTVELYQKLHRGPRGDKNNLFFYVSSASWNLFGLLQSFIHSNGFPVGPLLLQDLAMERRRATKTSHEHKLDRIGEIADLYQGLPLILIGDAGQRDPYLYLEVLRRYPDRIRAIFIRNTWWRPSTGPFEELIDEAKLHGVDMVFFDESAELSGHVDWLLSESSPALPPG